MAPLAILTVLIAGDDGHGETDWRLRHKSCRNAEIEIKESADWQF